MIRPDNDLRTRYGYIRRNDVQVRRLDDERLEESQKSGLGKMAGDMALMAIGTVVGGAMLRSSGRNIMGALTNFDVPNARESQWLRSAVGKYASQIKGELSGIDDALKAAQGIAEEPGFKSVSYFDVIGDAEKFVDGKISRAYVKRRQISALAGYARRAPYEIPAAYVTQRFAVEREQTKREIEEGRFNPGNPIDLIGDFALRSAQLMAWDMALHMGSPTVRAADEFFTKTNANYLKTKATVKVLGAEQASLLQGYTERLRANVGGLVNGAQDVAMQWNSGSILERATREAGVSTLSQKPLAVSGKSITRAFKIISQDVIDANRQYNIRGFSDQAAPTARFATDVNIFGTINQANEAGLMGEAIFGHYTATLQSQMEGQFKALGINPKMASTLVDLTGKIDSKSGGFSKGSVIRYIDDLAHGSKGDIDDVIKGADLDSVLDKAVQWAGIDLNPAQRDAIKMVWGQTSRNALPHDQATAMDAFTRAQRVAKSMEMATTVDFIRKQGRNKLDLRTGKLPVGSGAKQIKMREAMASEALDALGKNPWSMGARKRGELWNNWAAGFGSEQEAMEITKNFLVNKRRAFDTPLGQFNIFGLKRMSAAEMVGVEVKRRESYAKPGDQYGRMSSLFGGEGKAALQGMGRIGETTGSDAMMRMYGEKGLYIGANGKIVDLRWLSTVPERALGWAEKNMKIPITNFNPLQFFGTSSWLERRGRSVRYQVARGGLFERRIRPDLDTNMPLMQVGNRTYGVRQGQSTAEYIGDWTWFLNDKTTLASSIARRAIGMADEQVPTYQKGSKFRGRKFLTQDPERGLWYRLFGWMDFEQNADKSVLHQGWRRLNRSEDLRLTVGRKMGWLDDLPGGEVFNPANVGKNARGAKRVLWEKSRRPIQKIFELGSTPARNNLFVGNWFEDLVSRGAVSPQTEIDRKGIRLLLSNMGSYWNDRSAGVLAGDVLNKPLKVNDTLRQPILPNVDWDNPESIRLALNQMSKELDDPFVANSDIGKELRNTLNLIERETGRKARGVFDKARLESPVGVGANTSKVKHLVKQKVSEFYMMLSAVGDETSKLSLRSIESEIEGLRGRIDHETYKRLRTTLASVEMRIQSAQNIPITADEALVSRVREALGNVYGPSRGPQDVFGQGLSRIYRDAALKTTRTGRSYNDPVAGVRGLISSTFGTRGWRDMERSVISETTSVGNPFAGSMWIGIPSFNSKMGFVGGARELGAILRGDNIVDTFDEQANPIGTMAGTVFGGERSDFTKKFLHGEKLSQETTGTFAGWHIVGRVSDALDSVGLGIQTYKYKNPADLLVRGMVGKRALPAYAAILGLDLMAGVPIIGKMGLMGLGATMVGPGAAIGRATALSGMDQLKKGTQAILPEQLDAYADFIPSASFFETFSEVTGKDEDSRTRAWGRSVDDEVKYWMEGEDPIRQGRYWMLGNRRWKGDNIQYYRPNWWRMYMSDYKYNDAGAAKSLKGNRLEWAMFGTDISPLRALNPYHYEKKHAEDRPYPVTGPYFTGPWGPVTPLLNATLGSVMKPARLMHNDVATQQAALVGEMMTGNRGADVLAMYESGRVVQHSVRQAGATTMMGAVAQGSSQAAAQLTAINEQMREAGFGSIPKLHSLMAVSNATAWAMTSVSDSAGQGYTSGIVRALNKTQREPKDPLARMGFGGTPSSPGNEGLIPAPYMYVLGKPGRQQYAEEVPIQALAGKPSGAGFRGGELGYALQEWGGFYGFMMGSFRESFGGERDFTPDVPILQSADRMYGFERAFWDLDLGGMGDFPFAGTNVQLSEITRRFIPHRRRQMREVNDIPNRMPEWVPGYDSIINFKTGDPYVKVKLGEARLPGAGYESLNKLHPDMFGSYGAFDRFKILADVAPWTPEYEMYRRLMERGDLPEDLKKDVTRIKKQVANRRKKVATSEYMWKGDLQGIAEAQLSQNSVDPNLFSVEGIPYPVRLAGVRFSKTGNGRDQARALMQQLVGEHKVKIVVDKDRPLTRDNREKTVDAIIMAGDTNVNEEVLRRIRSGEIEGSESQSKALIDNTIRYNKAWQSIGSVWEKVAHMNIPILHTKLGRDSAAEYYERKMVYGKQWQPWETPYRSFIEPTVQSFTMGRGIASPVISGALMGWFTGMFFRGDHKNKARLIGAGVGAVMGGSRAIGDALRGQRWVPSRRREEWALDEYFDILSYIKNARLYDAARRTAIEVDGIDPEAVVQWMGRNADAEEARYDAGWQNAPVGGKPGKAPSNKVFAGTTPALSKALQYRRNMLGTMYGSELTGDYMAATAGIPARYKPLLEGWLNTPESERKDLLDILPRPVRRILQAQWGMKVERRPKLGQYFKGHELPPADWEGWLPQVDLEEVKIKVMKNEGLDTSEYGKYPNEVADALAAPWSYPDMFTKTGMSEGDIIQQMSLMGLSVDQIDIYPAPVGASGFDFDITQDRTGDMIGMMRQAFA